MPGSVDDGSVGETTPFKGPAPKAVPEDTSEIDKNEDIMPLTSPAGDRPVQFISGQPANGDAKVEIGDGGNAPQFVGLGKEELMKYANDPFWIRLRWLLFILFWALWVAMLAGAIVIIVMAPKCAEKKGKAETFYELNLKNFAKDGKLADLGERVNYLTDLGVTSLIISDVLKTDELGATMDYKNVDEDAGTFTEFTEAVKKLRHAGIRVLMSLVPNHSSKKHEWFTSHEFHDYYVRKPTSELFGSTWLTVDAKREAAWVTDAMHNDTKYLQLFSGTADLNFKNERVVEEFTGIVSFWKSKGVDAFFIPAASYLVEDMSRLADQSATKNQPENVDVLKTILNKQDSDARSYVEVEGLSQVEADRYIAAGIIPVSNDLDFSSRLDQYATLQQKIDFFKTAHKKSNPVLRLSGPSGRLQGQNQEESNIHRLLAYTSNASVILHYGDEVDNFNSSLNKMNWDTTTSNGETFTFLKKLGDVHKSMQTEEAEPGFTYPYKGMNKNIFAFVRSGKYAIIANYGSAPDNVNIGELFGKPDAKAKVVISTPNVAANFPKDSEQTGDVSLPGRSGVLLEKVAEA